MWSGGHYYLIRNSHRRFTGTSPIGVGLRPFLGIGTMVVQTVFAAAAALGHHFRVGTGSQER
jgi:hypothetical protein